MELKTEYNKNKRDKVHTCSLCGQPQELAKINGILTWVCVNKECFSCPDIIRQKDSIKEG